MSVCKVGSWEVPCGVGVGLQTRHAPCKRMGEGGREDYKKVKRWKRVFEGPGVCGETGKTTEGDGHPSHPLSNKAPSPFIATPLLLFVNSTLLILPLFSKPCHHKDHKRRKKAKGKALLHQYPPLPPLLQLHRRCSPPPPLLRLPPTVRWQF